MQRLGVGRINGLVNFLLAENGQIYIVELVEILIKSYKLKF